MSKSLEYMRKYRQKSGAGRNANNSQTQLANGEETYVKLPPSALYKDGQIIVAKDADGRYIYKVGFEKSTGAIDKNSTEYKRALRDYNVKAQFNADGSVTVTKGGLYSQKRKFKSVDAFQKETETRIDKYIDYYKKQEQATSQGRISQIQAENLKSSLKNSASYHSPLQQFGKSLTKDMESSRIQQTAAQDMKTRLAHACSEAKKKQK